MHLTQATTYLSLEGPPQRGFNEVPLRGLRLATDQGTAKDSCRPLATPA